MTLLQKPIRRELPSRTSGARNLIIELSPSGIITIREKGLRRGYDIEVTALFYTLIQLAIREEKKTRKR
jgi:hypothetical protein